MHGDSEVLGREVRESVGGRLVGHGEGIAQVFDGELAALLRPLEERDGVALGDHESGCEVVRLHALGEELVVVARLRAPQHVAGESLQQVRARVAARRVRDGQVDAPVLEVGDRPGRARQVAHVVQREAEVARELGGEALRERAALVPDLAQQVGRDRLELAEVVAARPHRLPQLGVGPPRLLGGRRALDVHALQFVVQGEHRLDRLVAERLAHGQRRDAQGREQRTLLRPRQGDLERRAATGRRRRQQLVERDADSPGDRLQLAELRLALAVLEARHVRGGHPDRAREVGERELGIRSQLPDALAEGQRIDHLFSLGREQGRWGHAESLTPHRIQRN